jgi:hypothetical protein
MDRGNNTTCTINLHGATIVSWRVNNQVAANRLVKRRFPPANSRLPLANSTASRWQIANCTSTKKGEWGSP